MKTRPISELYKQISVSYDGEHFAPYPAHLYMPLIRAFRRQSVKYWAVYGDIGGVLPDGETFIHERVMLACSKLFN